MIHPQKQTKAERCFLNTVRVVKSRLPTGPHHSIRVEQKLIVNKNLFISPSFGTVVPLFSVVVVVRAESVIKGVKLNK
jgi:hypothetical protein